MRLYDIKKLLHNKKNAHQIKEAAHRMRDILYQLYICQGIKNPSSL
jgi:hypothetical protein